jgi:hypothetical protein
MPSNLNLIISVEPKIQSELVQRSPPGQAELPDGADNFHFITRLLVAYDNGLQAVPIQLP